MQINTKDWGEFEVGKFFNLIPTKGATTDELIEGEDIPYIAAKKNLNGFSQMCSREGFEDWISAGHCIVFICLGAGSAGYTVYQDSDFIGMSGKTICGYPKDGTQLNSLTGNYLNTVLSLERPKYSFGRSWTGERLKGTKFKLPVTPDGNPDWQYMEEFMGGLHHEPLTTSKSSSEHSLRVDSWKEFRLGDLIHKPRKAKAHTKEDVDEISAIGADVIPYVSRTEQDNSVDMFVRMDDFEGIEEGNAIVVGDTTSTITYQPEQFIAGDHIVVIRADWLNQYTGLFVVGVLRQERYRYSYGRAYKKDLIEETMIKLPAKADGSPDWAWMEAYIKSLPMAEHLPQDG